MSLIRWSVLRLRDKVQPFSRKVAPVGHPLGQDMMTTASNRD